MQNEDRKKVDNFLIILQVYMSERTASEYILFFKMKSRMFFLVTEEEFEPIFL